MGYTMERLPDAPVILFTADEDYNIVKDQAGAVQEVLALMESEPEQLYLLLDISAISVSLEDVVFGANELTRGMNPLFKDPMVRGVTAVARQGMLKLAFKGLNTPIFGNVDVPVFDTADEAFDFIQSQH